MKFPSSVVVDPPLLPTKEPTANEVDAYVVALKKSFTEIYPRVLTNIKVADDRNKEYYDKRHNKE